MTNPLENFTISSIEEALALKLKALIFNQAEKIKENIIDTNVNYIEFEDNIYPENINYLLKNGFRVWTITLDYFISYKISIYKSYVITWNIDKIEFQTIYEKYIKSVAAPGHLRKHSCIELSI